METRFAEQKVRWELLEWGQHHTPPVQLRCMAIALDLTRLASEPDNPKLRRETMKRISRLEEEVRTEKPASTLGSSSGNENPPRQQHEPEHRPGRIASPVLAFVFGFLFIIYWNSTATNRSDPMTTGSAGTAATALLNR